MVGPRISVLPSANRAIKVPMGDAIYKPDIHKVKNKK